MASDVVAAFVSFGLYFGSLGLTLGLCFGRALTLLRHGSIISVYVLLALLAFAVCWYCILVWIYELYLTSGLDVVDWMCQVDIFDAAYVLVTNETSHWWWSSQHLLLNLSITVFFWAEGVHSSEEYNGQKVSWVVSAFVFVALSLLGAVSVGFSLFLAQHAALARTSQARNGISFVFVLMILSILSIVITPLLLPGSSSYSINLRLLHAFVILPVLLPSGIALTVQFPAVNNAKRNYLGLMALYFVIGLASFVSFAWVSWNQAWSSADPMTDLWTAVWSNLCQTSITFDYWFTSLTAIIFMAYETLNMPQKHRGHAIDIIGMLFIATPVLSLSATFPLFLMMRLHIHTSL